MPITRCKQAWTCVLSVAPANAATIKGASHRDVLDLHSCDTSIVFPTFLCDLIYFPRVAAEVACIHLQWGLDGQVNLLMFFFSTLACAPSLSLSKSDRYRRGRSNLTSPLLSPSPCLCVDSSGRDSVSENLPPPVPCISSPGTYRLPETEIPVEQPSRWEPLFPRGLGPKK